MKQSNDHGTLDLFGFRPVGRPKQAVTLSPAQRQAKYREAELNRAESRKARFAHLSDTTLARYMADPDHDCVMRRDLWLEFGRRQSWK